MTGALCDQPAQALGDGNAAAMDADQGDPLEIVGVLDQLVGDAREGSLDRLGVEDDLALRACDRIQGRYRVADSIPASFVISSPFRPLWTGLKVVPA